MNLVVSGDDEFNLDILSIREIKQLVFDGVIAEEAVIAYYNNEWWDETP